MSAQTLSRRVRVAAPISAIAPAARAFPTLSPPSTDNRRTRRRSTADNEPAIGMASRPEMSTQCPVDSRRGPLDLTIGRTRRSAKLTPKYAERRQVS